MSDSEQDLQNLDARLRAVESSTAAITTTIVNVGQDVSELKQMMQTFMAETAKIAELGAKVGTIDRVDRKVEDLDRKHDQLSNMFMSVQAEHQMCQLSKTRGEDSLISLHEKFNRLETGTLQQLAVIQADVSSLKASSNKVDGVLWKWGGNLGWILIAGLLYLLVTANGGDAAKMAILGKNPLLQNTQIEMGINNETEAPLPR